MDRKRLKQILDEISTTRVAVLGDFCLDAYWMIDPGAAEVSLETGKRTQPVKAQRYSLGGASNVVHNLVDLSVASVFAIGVIGDDLFGRELVHLLSEIGVNVEGLLIQERQWDTPVYGKPYYGDEEQQRIDFGVFNRIEPDTEQRLIQQLERTLRSVQSVIINQQLVSGIYGEDLVKGINRIIFRHPDKSLIVDSREISGAFRKAVLKLNQWEAARLAGVENPSGGIITREELLQCARKIKDKTDAKAVFITRESRGMVVYDGQEDVDVPGIQILNRIDPVGAGDTGVSAVAASLAGGATVGEAGELANFASAVTVRKLFQCGTASPEEIFEIGSSPDYVYHPELSEDPRRASFVEGTEIEIVSEGVQTGRIEHVIFDHDGTISALRQGWEQIMEPAMIRAILGDTYLSADEGLYHRTVERVRAYIDQSTRIHTIVQMQHLVEMVEEFGCVPPENILDRFGYKEIYNEALMEMVRKRLRKLQAGELDVEDFTIKGAVRFLDALYKRGVKLYIASGTDQEDVVREAEILGYAKLFDGRIYGATGDSAAYSKKIVVERILSENRLKGAQLCCFGDGPVELRETRKQGGIAVGVASDEVRRFGLNREKRTRLIKAGADVIVPDFSQPSALSAFLFGTEIL
jgi:rfaE bifunctional protein kinase chain/domain